jgi:hypothetical protein
MPSTLSPALISIALAGLLSLGTAHAADLGWPHGRAGLGRFIASCEDLGQFCFADGCGANQIDAALDCRAQCPSSAILSVVPGRCPLPVSQHVRVRLRSKG